MDEQRLKESAVAEAADAPRILVVDDEPVIREVLSDLLTSEGYSVRTAENGAVALEELMRAPYNLVLTDLKMPVMGGEELLARLAENNIKKIVIVLTAFATVETAIQTMKNGAYDYVMKPFKIDEITLIVRRALEKDRLERENIQLKEAQRLYEISEAMSSTLSLDKVLGIIIQSAKRESEADVVNLVLRDREDDILLLIRHFAKKYAKEFSKSVPQFSDSALQSIKGYYWPGNVRELENIIQRLVVLSESDWIEAVDLPALMRYSALKGVGLHRTLVNVESEHILSVLASVNNNKTRAAEILGIDRKTLREKLKRLDIPT